jgi:hypothetical protein
VCIYVYGGIQLTFQYTIISITQRLLYWCAKHGTITHNASVRIKTAHRRIIEQSETVLQKASD